MTFLEINFFSRITDTNIIKASKTLNIEHSFQESGNPTALTYQKQQRQCSNLSHDTKKQILNSIKCNKKPQHSQKLTKTQMGFLVLGNIFNITHSYMYKYEIND